MKTTNETYFGVGSLSKLKSILNQHNPKKIILFTSHHSFSLSGAKEKILPILKNISVNQYEVKNSNPYIEDIKSAIQEYTIYSPEMVIAVGGGHVLDFAKAVNFLSGEDGDLDSLIRNNSLKGTDKKPLIAIPTTAGSGAEETKFAVIYIDKEKHSIEHSSIRPAYRIVDPILTYSLPKNIVASSGIDALAQSIESFWSINSTEESKKYAREAINLLRDNLLKSYESKSKEAKNKVSLASNLAGKAINISKTTAAHALSYGLTIHHGILHGEAVAIFLPSIYLFNSEITRENCIDSRGVNYVKDTISELNNLFGCSNSIDASNEILKMSDSLGILPKYYDLKLGAEEKNTLISIVNLDRLKNNPRAVREKDLERIYNSLIEQ